MEFILAWESLRTLFIFNWKPRDKINVLYTQWKTGYTENCFFLKKKFSNVETILAQKDPKLSLEEILIVIFHFSSCELSILSNFLLCLS